MHGRVTPVAPNLAVIAAKHLTGWAVAVVSWTGVATLIGNASLFSSDTLFGIVGPIFIVIVAGFFTIRSNVAKIWRENYEAEVEKNKQLIDAEKEQRELKHNALNELAAAKLELVAEKSKPDYAAVIQRLDRINARLDIIETKQKKET